MDKATVSLVLLVKDEAPSIEKIIESAELAIDRVDVLDTGSTDGTQELVRKTCDRLAIPYSIHEEPFVDFSTSRNRALALAEPHAVFGLQLSGDEYLTGALVLRDFCVVRRDQTGLGKNLFHVTLRIGNLTWKHSRLVRLGSGWQWYGPVHEGMDYKQPEGGDLSTDVIESIVSPECFIRHEGYDEARKKRRFHRDLELLRAEWLKSPHDPRTLFYLAQTYEGLEAWGEAARLFAMRSRMTTGWEEERFQASFRSGLNVRRAGFPGYEATSMFLAAAGMRPWRAEPFMALAEQYLLINEIGTAYVFASSAARLAYPANDALLVEEDIYEWKAAYYVALTAGKVGQFEEGERATLKVLETEHAGVLREAFGKPVTREDLEHRLGQYRQEIERARTRAASPFAQTAT